MRGEPEGLRLIGEPSGGVPEGHSTRPGGVPHACNEVNILRKTAAVPAHRTAQCFLERLPFRIA